MLCPGSETRVWWVLTVRTDLDESGVQTNPVADIIFLKGRCWFKNGSEAGLAKIMLRVEKVELIFDGNSQLAFTLGRGNSMAFGIAENPEGVALAHDKPGDPVEPIVLMFQAFCLIGWIW